MPAEPPAGQEPDSYQRRAVDQASGAEARPGRTRGPAEWAAPHGPVPEPRLDVLIPTCDRPAELATVLAGLAAQDVDGCRVIVSDQSRGAPSWEHPAAQAMLRVLRAQGRTVAFMRHLPRRGLAEHRHFLLEQSSAPQVLFLDDDVWLAPGALGVLSEALDALGCGFVGMAVQGLSFLDERRPGELEPFEPWDDGVQPERLDRGSAEFARWRLHNAANPAHLAETVAREGGLGPRGWLPYRVAWIGGCVLYRREALVDCGGFSFWPELPSEHAGEDVVAQWGVMERYGGAGILPSYAVHLESPTTVPYREAEASEVLARRGARGNGP